MKRLVFLLAIWLLTLKGVLATQWLETFNKDTQINQISKIKSFTGFWEIRLTKSFRWLTTLWYKKEIFDASGWKYLFEYKFLTPSQLTIPLQPTAKWEINFDSQNIKNLNILIWKEFIIQWEIETWNKLRLSIKQINDPNPIYSKVRDLQEYQFDIFLPYLIPYLNLKQWQTYIFKTIDITALDQQTIKTTNIEVNKKNNYNYSLKIRDYEIQLFYNSNNTLVRYETPFYVAQLISDPAKQKQIEDQINIKPVSKTKKPEQSQQKSITWKSNLSISSKNFWNAVSWNKLFWNKLSGFNRYNNNRPQTNNFTDLKNLNIKKEIEKASRRYKPKLCPLINK